VPIKESSDELNPEVVVIERVERAAGPRSVVDYVALAVATCGVGYIPIAPGTWGSLVGVGLCFSLHYAVVRTALESARALRVGIQLTAIAVIILLGIWAASKTERLLGRKDPGKVVVDEVAGQMIALLPITIFGRPWNGWVIVSFILFRFFDIVKPYPARQLEGLHGGRGIMADDLIAGIYAAAITAILLAVV
jgi:phosphatidylglycerophosphatase A